MVAMKSTIIFLKAPNFEEDGKGRIFISRSDNQSDWNRKCDLELWWTWVIHIVNLAFICRNRADSIPIPVDSNTTKLYQIQQYLLDYIFLILLQIWLIDSDSVLFAWIPSLLIW